MLYALLFPCFRSIILVVFVCCLSISGHRLSAQTLAPSSPPQDAPAKTDSTAKSAPSASPNEEVSSHDTPTTFKVRVNLVLVRVVVRDAQGKVVPNLKKEDFQLLDNRKLQSISSFNVETPESHTLRTAAAPGTEPNSPEGVDSAGGKPVDLPHRFVSMVFDDVHMS